MDYKLVNKSIHWNKIFWICISVTLTGLLNGVRAVIYSSTFKLSRKYRDFLSVIILYICDKNSNFIYSFVKLKCSFVVITFYNYGNTDFQTPLLPAKDFPSLKFHFVLCIVSPQTTINYLCKQVDSGVYIKFTHNCIYFNLYLLISKIKFKNRMKGVKNFQRTTEIVKD